MSFVLNITVSFECSLLNIHSKLCTCIHRMFVLYCFIFYVFIFVLVLIFEMFTLKYVNETQ